LNSNSSEHFEYGLKGKIVEITISVIIPFYKEGKFLGDAIESVLAQTIQDFEIILVDNNATEETRQIATYFAQRHPNTIRILHEPEQGAPSARNHGILNAKGEFIALLDGDDMMKPERLARQLETLRCQPDVSLVSCYHDFVAYDGKKIIEKNIPELSYNSKNIFEFKKILKQLFLPFNFPYIDSFDLFSAPFLFFKRENAIKAGLFDTRLNPRDKDDWEFTLRMFMLGKFVLIPESLEFYRDENPQTRKLKMKELHKKRVILHEQKFIGILWEKYGLDYPQNYSTFKKLIAFTLKRFGCHMMGFTRGKKIGRVFLKRAVVLYPSDIRAWKFYIKSLSPKCFYPRLFEFDNLKETDIELDIDLNDSRMFLKWPPFIPEKMVNQGQN
jgi:glycosyltransferase involved in cell wall biosynthesis